MSPLEDHPISRRDLFRGAATGMVALALGIDSKGAPPATKPNIVFILADDLGFADVACYGRPDLSTPNIDHLAAQGVRFLQAYANSAVCTATRTALITGRYQYRLRLGLRSRWLETPTSGWNRRTRRCPPVEARQRIFGTTMFRFIKPVT